MNLLANVLSVQGELEEAETIFRKALAIREKVFGMEYPDTVESMGFLASVLIEQGNFEETELLYRQALAIRKRIWE